MECVGKFTIGNKQTSNERCAFLIKIYYEMKVITILKPKKRGKKEKRKLEIKQTFKYLLTFLQRCSVL